MICFRYFHLNSGFHGSTVFFLSVIEFEGFFSCEFSSLVETCHVSPLDTNLVRRLVQWFPTAEATSTKSGPRQQNVVFRK